MYPIRSEAPSTQKLSFCSLKVLNFGQTNQKVPLHTGIVFRSDPDLPKKNSELQEMIRIRNKKNIAHTEAEIYVGR